MKFLINLISKYLNYKPNNKKIYNYLNKKNNNIMMK